jgi:hypothetical protein
MPVHARTVAQHGASILLGYFRTFSPEADYVLL